MQVVARPSLCYALAALLLCVALCGAEINSWQPVGTVPQYFVQGGEVTFQLNAPGSDLQLLTGNTSAIDPTFDTLVVFVNGVNVWNVSGASIVPPPGAPFTFTNITLPNTIPPMTATTIQWQLYTNDTLVDGPWTTTVPPVLAGSIVQAFIGTPGNESAVFPDQIRSACIFTADVDGLYYYLQEEAEFLSDTTWRCTIDDVDVSELAEFPVATPFLLSVNVSRYGGLSNSEVVVPAAEAVYLNTTSSFYGATSTATGLQYACVNTIWINATGNFYTDRFYSCVVSLDFNGKHQVVSSPALAVNSSLVTCPFNTSRIIYLPTKDGITFLNSYTLVALVESTSTLANGSVVAGDYASQLWMINSCNKGGTGHSILFYILVPVGSGLVAAAVVATIAYFVFFKGPDPAAAPLLRGQSVNA